MTFILASDYDEIMAGNPAVQIDVNEPNFLINPQHSPKKFFLILISIILISALLIIFLINLKIINISTFIPTPTKQVPVYQKQINQLDSLLTSVNELPGSFNPRINQEESESRKRNVAFYVEDIKEALKNGEVEKTRELLGKGLKSNIFSFEDPLQAKFVPEDLKRLHDPKDKYIGKDRVDPRILDIYLQVIDVLVAIDKSY